MSESPPKSANGATPPLDLKAQFAGKKMVIVGGTGFLGKVFWSMMLYEYPEVTRLYVLVRPRKNQTPQQRFADDIIQSEAFEPLRRQHGDNFDTFIADKVVPIGGDVVEPFCGFSSELRDELRGDVAVVINASGVVDFEPPLDIALQVNAFGVKSVVELAKDLGDCPVLHTSTCFVAGARTGQVEELNPSEHPFPRDGELERAHWDADGEISECLDVIEQARHRAGDAFRQSSFLDEAKRNLMARGESTRGSMLESEIAKVRRKFIESELAERGRERAQFWGWPNTYTYTKSIGEQIVVGSGLDYAIARPAIVESSVKYPCKGWNEGINTSAPLIYLIREGQLQIPGSKINLDIIPCDMVAGGMLLTLGELLEGRAKPVYQYGSSDTNPVTVARIVELTGLYKRELWRKTGRGGPAYGAFQTNFETSVLSADQFDIYGPLAISRGASKLSSWVGGLAKGALKPLLKPAADGLKSFAHQQNNIGTILAQYLPFTAKYSYVFQCDNTHAAYARLTDEDREKIIWAPQDLDWRDWMLDVHIPGLEKWVFPNLADKLSKPKPPPKRYETLPAILDEMAERYELSVALQQTEPDGLSRISFRQWHERSLACAKRLQEAGVNEGDRVMLSGANQPSWPIAFFGIMLAGATTVPVDAGIEADVAVNLLKASGAKVFIADGETQARVGDKISELADVKLSDMVEIAQGGAPIAPVDVSSADVAALIYTSGTTGSPKGVMLSHHNLTSLIAALTPLFPLGRGDRVMSVLPLHHTFELTCGLLLPLTRGSRILYIDELTGEKLSHGLKAGRITAMVGVPALWEMLERKLHERIADRGPMAVKVFDIAIDLNRTLSQSTGLDAGKLLFGPVHAGLGGHLKFLVSGGAALSPATHKTFAGMGLHLSEGYGLTEASPVITVSNPKPGERAGHVGKPLAGTELKIHDPDPKGIGEVYARGPTIMLGYADDEEATRDAIDDDGWLHTGDLGKLDRKGNLVLVGRAKDVVVTSAGENIYPDDVEERLGKVAHVAELTLLGMDDANGGERLALVAVPEPDSSRDRAQMRTLAKTSLKEAVNELPAIMRPASTTLVDIPLPRTPTRKVQRRAVKDLLARLEPVDMAASGAVDSDAASKMVRGAAAAIGRKDPESLGPATTLRGDLGFDSLMLLELLVALERRVGCTLDADQLSDCETIGEAEALVRLAGSQAAGSIGAVSIDSGEGGEMDTVELPEPLRQAAMQWLGQAQKGFYDSVLHTRVIGRAHIPQNRSVIVAANHASHLDQGLVKYALGDYGRDMTSMAAQDYFFEGNKWRKAYFENFTNLVPVSRTGSLRQGLEQAAELLERGQVVLLFPEGTRCLDGELQEFKPIIGHLALEHGVDVLPIYLGGTFAALPKGATAPRGRNVSARIGPPLAIVELRRLTDGQSASEAARTVARITERAVRELSHGRVLNLADKTAEDFLSAAEEPMTDLFSELGRRFAKAEVEEPVSFYFSLGGEERWTIRVDKDNCLVEQGKTVADADCVLKTSTGMFTRMVREGYAPSPSEFMAGTIKSNNVALLVAFQKIFQLADRV